MLLGIAVLHSSDDSQSSDELEQENQLRITARCATLAKCGTSEKKGFVIPVLCIFEFIPESILTIDEIS